MFFSWGEKKVAARIWVEMEWWPSMNHVSPINNYQSWYLPAQRRRVVQYMYL